jgi:hypothetical protein
MRRRTRRRPCRRHVFLSALNKMKQTFPRYASFKDARNAHKNTRYNVLSAPRKRASDAPRERISRDARIERVFQERGGFFAQETARAIAPSERNARSNANERAEIGAPLFLSFLISLKTSFSYSLRRQIRLSFARCFTRRRRRRRRRQM